MAPKSPLLEQVRRELRLRHMSIRTEEAYVRWITEFLQFSKDKAGAWRHPREMGGPEVNEYLTYLAVERKVAASTQNQAAGWHRSNNLLHLCATASGRRR